MKVWSRNYNKLKCRSTGGVEYAIQQARFQKEFKMIGNRVLLVVLCMILCVGTCFSHRDQWTVEQANTWYAKQPWLVGCNFLPSTAINQIEMWQAESWDPETINRELGWAQELGFNTIRVYLHDLVYYYEKEGFLRRMDIFLDICQKRCIRPIFVFFDDCHWAGPRMGKQPDPIPGVHNSGWKQSPGWRITKAYENGTIDPVEKRRLENYIKGVLTHFKEDARILGWDLYNEPGQAKNTSTKLLCDTWQWAWEVRSSQPLTACVAGAIDNSAKKINAANSDIYSFHTYDNPDQFKRAVEHAMRQANGRPVFCTEYMARNKGNTFELCMPLFKKYKIACLNWGLVDGKSGTKWPWSSRKVPGAGDVAPMPTRDPNTVTGEPELWFHDILRKDGTAYKQTEVDFIKKITQWQ